MSQETKPYRTNVHLTFPPTISGAPLVCNLTRLFDLDFNISTAQKMCIRDRCEAA